MLGSIFIGLSGMNAFSRGLRQISNNITNLNSTGFKAAELGFVNLFGQGSGGQGVAMRDGRIDFSQGELRQSDRDLDLAIDGAGFLVLLKDAEHVFTRTGSFEVNDDGDIVLAGTDYKLTVIDGSGAPTALSIGAHRLSHPQATTKVTFADNLSTTASTHTISNIKVFDAAGAVRNWQVKFERGATSAPGEWSVTVTEGSTVIGTQTLKFIGSIPDPSTAKLSFGAAGAEVELDFSAASSLSTGEVSTLRVSKSDGYATGEITSMGVNADGEFEISYSNEQKKTLGSITLATFTDPQRLEAMSNGLFSYEGANGRQFLTSASASVGKAVSGRLEASNVDLSHEFGELILVQRGYQASAQVISVSNDMIQQLFGIRGQG